MKTIIKVYKTTASDSDYPDDYIELKLSKATKKELRKLFPGTQCDINSMEDLQIQFHQAIIDEEEGTNTISIYCKDTAIQDNGDM